MVVSLFVNALLTLVSTFAKSHSQQLLMWQTGSFNGRRWYHVQILFPVCLIGVFHDIGLAAQVSEYMVFPEKGQNPGGRAESRYSVVQDSGRDL